MAVRAVKSFVKKEYDTTPKITKVTFVADSGAVDETSFELLVDLGGESLGRFIHYQADLPSVRGVCVRRATITITEIPNAETEPNNSTESQEAK